jgi:hypothetical protein
LCPSGYSWNRNFCNCTVCTSCINPNSPAPSPVTLAP